MEALGESLAVKERKIGASKSHSSMLTFLIALFIGAAAIIPHIISGNGVFILSNDYGGLFVPQHMLISEVLKSGNIFWNWSLDLGGNFYESIGVGNPFNLILMFYPTEAVPFIMPWLTVLKIAIAALTADLYLKRHLKHDITVVISSLLYAFSGFQIMSIMYYIFADFIAAFPLMLLGVELLVEEKKHGALLIASFLNILLGGIAIFYGEVLFTVLYFIMKYFNADMLASVKAFLDRLKNILFCLVEGALGLLCAGFSVMPALINLLGNSRITERIQTENFLTISTVNWLQAIKSFMLPAEPMNHGAALEPFNWYSNGIYLPVVGMLLVVAYLIKKRDWKSRMVKLLLVAAVVPLLSSAFMALSYEPYRRWYYMFSLILALVSGSVLDEYQDYPIFKSFTINICTLLAYYLLTFACLWQGGAGNMVLQKGVYFTNLLIAVIGLLICLICYWKKLKTTMPIILTAVIAVSWALTTMHLTLHHTTEVESHTYDSYNFASYDKSYYENVYAFLTETTEDLSADILPYRYSFEDLVGYSYYDFGMSKNLPSINSFLTSTHSSIAEFYKSLNFARKNMTPEIDTAGKILLGAKYIVSTEDKLADEFKLLNKKTLSSGQEIFYYENEKALPIGFTHDKYLRRSEFDLLGNEYRTIAMLNALIIDDKDEETVSKILPHQENCVYDDLRNNIDEVIEERRNSSIAFEARDNYFYSAVVTETDSYAFFSVPYDKNWSAWVNDEKVEVINTNGLMAVPVHAGVNEIEFFFEYPLLNYAILISAAGAALSALYISIFFIIRRRKSKSPNPDPTDNPPEDDDGSTGIDPQNLPPKDGNDGLGVNPSDTPPEDSETTNQPPQDAPSEDSGSTNQPPQDTSCEESGNTSQPLQNAPSEGGETANQPLQNAPSDNSETTAQPPQGASSDDSDNNTDSPLQSFFRKISQKELAKYLIFLLFSALIGYICASLGTFNEVHTYIGIGGIPTKMVLLFIAFTADVFAIIIALRNTRIRNYIKSLFRVFEPEKKFDTAHIICGLFVFISIYLLVINRRQPNADYTAHIDTAMNFNWSNPMENLTREASPLWHMIVSLLNKVFYIPELYAAAMTSAMICTAEYFIIRKIIIAFNKEIAVAKIKLIDILALTMMYLQPIYIKWFNPEQYLGQGTPNVWHNPTTICCYPFALICVYLFVKMLQSFKNKEEIHLIDYMRSGIYLFLSVTAKPAFIQIFAPAVAAVFVIMLIKTKGKGFFFELKYFLSCIPAGLYCIAIFMIAFVSEDTSEGNTVAIGFFNIWRTNTMSIPVSMMLGLGFPIAYFAVQRRNIGNKVPYYFSLLCLLFGFLETSFLYETGDRMYHGNFGWGYLIGMTLIFCYTAADWLKPLLEKKKTMIFPLVVYCLHLICGFRYYIEMFKGNMDY